MSRYTDHYQRLEPHPGVRDLQNGFAARLHDPLWFLARQWQMGEHQGENASSPVRVACAVTRSPMLPLGGDPARDPAVTPAEALVEAELDDWWTLGRRARVGHGLRERPELAGADGLRFVDPPPPYEALSGHIDGRAVFRARARLGLTDADFGADAPPNREPLGWRSTHLDYETTIETNEATLSIRRHHGGPMDWYSADAAAVAAPIEAELQAESGAIPTPLEYPGAPHSRFWEIEDADVDIGGYPPDAAHFATMLLVDLIYSHSDDWFLFPVRAAMGSIVTLRSLAVTDGFGRTYDSETLAAGGKPLYPGLRAPDGFGLFRCDGLPAESLVLWSVAQTPLAGAPLERVQFGVDEQSNVLWALERVLDTRSIERAALAEEPAHPAYPAALPSGDATRARGYVYAPATASETRWHPYSLDWKGPERLEFVQQGLLDYSKQVPRPMPHPEAAVLTAGPPDAPELHRIAAEAVAGGGFELERRWQLSRDLRGKPVLWMVRERRVLRTPPARTLRYDVLEENANAA